MGNHEYNSSQRDYIHSQVTDNADFKNNTPHYKNKAEITGYTISPSEVFPEKKRREAHCNNQ